MQSVLPRRELLEHIRHDPAGQKIGRLDWRIDSQQQRYRRAATIPVFDAQCRRLTRTHRPAKHKVEALGAVEPEALCADAFRQLTRQHAHADQIGPMNPLESAGNDGPHIEQTRAFGGQSRELPAP